jgi:small subunit ribosomal protein S18
MKRTRKKPRRVNKDCYFCKSKTLPDYKDPSVLRRSMTDRGKLLSGKLTGVCSKHQRKLRKQVLRARFLALVPYVEKPL